MISGLSRTHKDNQGINAVVPERQLHGPSRMLSSSRTGKDQHGNFELPKTAALASRSDKDISRTFQEIFGSTRSYTVHMPDHRGYNP
ncbi:hypothetical protein DPMN_193087 [Dreissena polymorpha]|uniref:Uncharacterized protein n=1 Tax=Dreissena polymorpha TaxID=45954 RepID=A0A9D3Y3K3_DREPO|nr:hypothetical protein DPMN_193087 [Dreissena polymorpha]